MVQIALGHTSALEYWLNRSSDYNPKCTVSKIHRIPPRRLDTVAIQNICEDLFLFNKPYTLLTAVNDRLLNSVTVCHLAPSCIPNDSFVKADSNVIVASPELCFVQMAPLLPFEQLLLLGYSFTGLYSQTPGGTDFITRKNPLTTKQKLNNYIDSIDGIRGKSIAKRALLYIQDCAASPMEAALTMLLCLPSSLGGYGLPMPKLNGSVKNDNAGPTNTYRCDLLWEEQRVAVEYDSNQWHTGVMKINKDAMRRNNITAKGITTITATSNQLYDKLSFEKLASCVANQLNKRLRIRCSMFPQAQNQLRFQVLQRNRYESFFL